MPGGECGVECCSLTKVELMQPWKVLAGVGMGGAVAEGVPTIAVALALAKVDLIH